MVTKKTPKKAPLKPKETEALAKEIKSTNVKTELKQATNASGKTPGMVIAAFVLSLLGLAPYVGLLCAITGFVLGILSYRQIKRDPTLSGKGLAVASIVIGGLIILLVIILIILAFTTVAYFGALSPEQFLTP